VKCRELKWIVKKITGNLKKEETLIYIQMCSLEIDNSLNELNITF